VAINRASLALGGGEVGVSKPASRLGHVPTDRDAGLTTLFLGYHRQLVGFALLLVDDLETAEDVVQDAFLALHRRWTWVRDPQAAYEYLRTSVLNGSRSQLRRRRTRRALSAPLPRTAPSAEATAADHEEQDAVLHELAALSTRQRQVLVLRYYLDQSEAEIARTLQISAGSVKQHASRGLAALTERLEAQS
jgi:RNA polymerase sigma-70 factor (sigma-E family)